MTKKSEWIDFAKLLAILAVLLDHTGNILYTRHDIAYLSFYSVGVFIIIMGITSYWSFDRMHSNLGNKIKKKCLGIMIPYLVASFFYCIYLYKSFHLKNI